jgi:hypothetical protein
MIELTKKKQTATEENFDKIVKRLDDISSTIFRLVRQTELENKKDKIKTKDLEISK